MSTTMKQAEVTMTMFAAEGDHEKESGSNLSQKEEDRSIDIVIAPKRGKYIDNQYEFVNLLPFPFTLFSCIYPTPFR